MRLDSTGGKNLLVDEHADADAEQLCYRQGA
jgi:hypothetical protein